MASVSSDGSAIFNATLSNDSNNWLPIDRRISYNTVAIIIILNYTISTLTGFSSLSGFSFTIAIKSFETFRNFCRIENDGNPYCIVTLHAPALSSVLHVNVTLQR